MASARTFEVDEGVVSSPVVKVNKACKFFGEKGDEGLAHNLQGEEFDKKYDWNREVRRIARKDVPLARATYDEEEELIQRQRLEFLQNQTKLSEADAELARQFQREEENLAKEEKERRRRRREAKDRELAKRLEEMGVRDECDSKDYADGREFDSSRLPNGPLGIEKLAYLQSFAGLGVRRFRDDDYDDDIPDEERRQLMMLQDQELALAIQEYESLSALRAERHRTQEENRLQRSQEEERKTNPVDSSSSSSSSPSRSRVAHRQESTATKTTQSSEQEENKQGTRRGRQDGYKNPTEATARQHHQQQQQQSSPGPPNRNGQSRPSGDASGGSERPTPVQPNPSSSSINGRTADRSVTMVTSVGNSAFYKNVEAKKTGSQSASVEGKSLPNNSGKRF